MAKERLAGLAEAEAEDVRGLRLLEAQAKAAGLFEELLDLGLDPA